jgi:hypothetical protein
MGQITLTDGLHAASQVVLLRLAGISLIFSYFKRPRNDLSENIYYVLRYLHVQASNQPIIVIVTLCQKKKCLDTFCRDGVRYSEKGKEIFIFTR